MISVIGAGPAGCYVSYLLAKKGKDVSIFEEHSEIGKPVQCTGIVTSTLEDIIPIEKRFLVNKVDKVKVFSPGNNNIEFKLKNPNFVLDRKRFDRALAEKARKAGVKFFMNHKFIDFKKPYVIFDDKKPYKTDILIGADGPMSRVAKVSGLFGKRKFFIGLQARINSKFDRRLVEFHLHNNYFGWVVPESSDIARIGIATRNNAKSNFKEFLRKLDKNYRTKEYQSGLIPVYDPSIRTQKDSVYLVGDAATMVKPTTLGGIIQGLIAAQELTNAIVNNKNYASLWKGRIGRELRYGSLIRRMMDNFSSQDYEDLITLVDQKEVKRIISNIDRDFPSQIIFKLALKEPKLLKFVKNIY